MGGAGGVLSGDIGKPSEAFFFVSTLLALAVTATFSLILSVRALCTQPRHNSRLV
jgi:hypothetical protein